MSLNKNRETLNLAAIDIGSNAARILIKSVERTASSPGDDCKATRPDDDKLRSKKLLFLRIPTRLGMDVFAEGRISAQREEMLIRSLKIFRDLMAVFDVRHHVACATSALRDASNGREIIARAEKEAGLRIRIISGEEEARVIRDNYAAPGHLLYMDVGGGSTELSLVSDGDIVASRSFNVGTLRMAQGKVRDGMWQEMDLFLRRAAEELGDITIIGSGGNINKLCRMAPRHSKKKDVLPVSTLASLHQQLAAMTLEERIRHYDLRPDRADVIVPAAELFLRVCRIVGAESVVVPNVGLADGLLNELASKVFSAKAHDGGG